MNEIKALKKLSHPNIVKLFAVYEMEEELCLVMEYVVGDRVFDEIVRTKGIPEKDVAILMNNSYQYLAIFGKRK